MTDPITSGDDQLRILGINITEGFASALADFQAEIPILRRDRTVEVETKGDKPNYDYAYATLANVTQLVLPQLGRRGLAWTAMPTLGGDGKPVLRFVLMHKTGGYVSGEYPLRGEGGYQAIGSAITYVRRYCLQAVTGVAAEEDDDAAKADEEQRAAGTTAARRRGAAARTEQAAANTTRRNAAARQDNPPPAEDAPPAETMARRNPEGPITTGEQKKIFAQFRDIGLADREQRAERLQVASDLMGRELTSVNDLTSGQAGDLIETLNVVIAAADTIEGRQEALEAACEAAKAANASEGSQA